MFWRKRNGEPAEIKAELASLEGQVRALTYAVSVGAAVMPTDDLTKFGEAMKWIIGTRMATKKPAGAIAAGYPQIFRDSMSAMMQSIVEDAVAIALAVREEEAVDESRRSAPPVGHQAGREPE